MNKFYFSIIYRIMESLSELIMQTVLDSGISVADDFKVIFGEYMDQAVILNTGEKKDNEINDSAALKEQQATSTKPTRPV